MNINKPKILWYWKRPFVIIMVLSVLVLALPLVVFNPHLSKKEKIIWTVVAVVLTWLTFASCAVLFDAIQKAAPELKQLGLTL